MDVLKVAALLLLMFEELGTSSSGNYEVPNMSLKGFTYWSTTLGNKYQCESLCWKSIACRSVNFNMQNGICELNYKGNETNDDVKPEKGILFIIPNDQENYQPSRGLGRPCEENELGLQMDAMRNHQCLPIDIPCQTPEPLLNAYIDVQDTSYKAKAEFKCDVGFKKESDLEIECKFPRRWSKPSGQCKVVNCGHPKPMPYSMLDLGKPGNTTYGAKADQTCVEGFTMETGTLEMLCETDGNWTQPTGYCKAVECSSPTSRPYATVILGYPGNTTYTATAHYTCDRGYVSKGAHMTVMCQSDGQWSKASGDCEPVDCGQPITHNGTPTLTVGGNTSYTATGKVICDSLFTLSSGDRMLRCLETGKWSEARCSPIDCGQPITPNGTSTLTVGGNTTYNATGKVICDSLFTLSSGDNIIRCLETGRWSEARCILCNDSLTNHIPDSSFTASSQYNENHGPERGRLHTQEEWPKDGSWSAQTNDESQWLQVDLLRPAQIHTVTTQGRQEFDQWITKYTVEYSVDAKTWKQITDENGAVQMFDGNTDQNTPVTNSLDNEVTARYVKIRPQAWYNHVSLRMDVNGC